MFTLPEPTAIHLDHVQSRVEHHGDDKVPAIDLALTLKAHNRVLDSLHPQLRAMLFNANGAPQDDEQQQGLDLPISELPNVRVPGVAYPIKLDFEQQGARLFVEYGIDAGSGVQLTLCKLHKVRVTPIEGGSCEIKFALSSSAEIDEHVIGLLSMLQQQEITVTLTMPEPAISDTGTPEEAFAETAAA
jgi:hypothetical protein